MSYVKVCSPDNWEGALKHWSSSYVFDYIRDGAPSLVSDTCETIHVRTYFNIMIHSTNQEIG